MDRSKIAEKQQVVEEKARNLFEELKAGFSFGLVPVNDTAEYCVYGAFAKLVANDPEDMERLKMSLAALMKQKGPIADLIMGAVRKYMQGDVAEDMPLAVAPKNKFSS